MNTVDLLEALGDVREEYLREARAVREQPKGSYRSPKQRAEEVRLKQAVKDCESAD